MSTARWLRRDFRGRQLRNLQGAPCRFRRLLADGRRGLGRAQEDRTRFFFLREFASSAKSEIWGRIFPVSKRSRDDFAFQDIS